VLAGVGSRGSKSKHRQRDSFAHGVGPGRHAASRHVEGLQHSGVLEIKRNQLRPRFILLLRDLQSDQARLWVLRIPSLMTDFPVRSVKGFLRQIAEDARCVNRLVRGFVRYSSTGITPDDAHHSMIRLYCRTNGRSNDFLHAPARRRYPAARLSHADGVLGRLSKNDAEKIAAQIREQGSARQNQRLPKWSRSDRSARCSPAPRSRARFRHRGIEWVKKIINGAPTACVQRNSSRWTS